MTQCLRNLGRVLLEEAEDLDEQTGSTYKRRARRAFELAIERGEDAAVVNLAEFLEDEGEWEQARGVLESVAVRKTPEVIMWRETVTIGDPQPSFRNSRQVLFALGTRLWSPVGNLTRNM